MSSGSSSGSSQQNQNIFPLNYIIGLMAFGYCMAQGGKDCKKNLDPSTASMTPKEYETHILTEVQNRRLDQEDHELGFGIHIQCHS